MTGRSAGGISPERLGIGRRDGIFSPTLTGGARLRARRFRFHDLRHTFATRLIQAGVDVYTVQKLGRWKTIAMVLRYAHHQPESLRGGAEVLDRLRRESSTILAQGMVVASGGTA